MELGLTSVTFRELDYHKILSYCVESGLTCIEWGSDVHVPQTDSEHAKAVRKASEEAGIRISSYGSYYKLCVHENVEAAFRPYLETAVLLGAPIIRLWSGEISYDDASKEYYAQAVRETQKLCDMAAKHRVTLAFEYHNGCLSDNGDHAMELLKDVDRSNFGLYFQYDSQVSIEENWSSLEKMLPHVVMVHVAYRGTDGKRLYLDEGEGPRLWSEIVRKLQQNNIRVSLLFEFLRDSSLEGLLHQTKAMSKIITSVEELKND